MTTEVSNNQEKKSLWKVWRMLKVRTKIFQILTFMFALAGADNQQGVSKHFLPQFSLGVNLNHFLIL